MALDTGFVRSRFPALADGFAYFDNAGGSLVLREVAADALVVALKGSATDIREKVLKNMSQRAAEGLREDLESRGPIRLLEVEARQKEILKVIRRLADSGEISLGGGNDDAYV